MKKLFFAAMSASLIFTACERLEPFEPDFTTVGTTNEINISNVKLFGSNPGIEKLAFVARFRMPHGAGGEGSTLDGEGNDARVILEIPFDAAGTKLVLPQNPPEELMRDISADFPSDFTISDPAAKTIHFAEIACDMSTDPNREGAYFNRFLHFYLRRKSETYVLRYIYCDRPATVTGEGEDWWKAHTVYDLYLQKGWNMVVEKIDWNGESQSKSVTHLMPEGMRWEENMCI